MKTIKFIIILFCFFWGRFADASTCYSAYTPTLSASQQTVCSGNTVTLYANGSLRNNNYWAWYKDGCASTSIGTGWSINVSPTTTTTYYARGEGGCAPGPGPCGSITISVVQGINPPLTTDLFQCNPGTVTLNATPSGNNQTVDWFNVATGGSPLSGGYGMTSYTTPFLSSFTTYYARARDTLTGCYSSSRNAATVYIGSYSNSFWTAKANFLGYGRYNGVSFSINGLAYTGTGITSGNSNTDEFWEYDPQSDTWTQKANFGGGPRHSAIGFSIGSKGYIGAGEHGPPLNDFWEYNPTSNLWVQKSNVPGAGRIGAASFSNDIVGYAGLGNNGNYGGVTNWYNDFWKYNPIDDSWTQMSDFPGLGLVDPVCANLNSKALICTGYLIGINTNALWEYNLLDNTWTTRPPLPANPRGAAFGFSLGSKFYIGGGTPDGGTTSYTDFWEYDPSTQVWSIIQDVGGNPRCFTNYFSVGGKGYVLSGISSGGVPYNQLWEFNPEQSIQTISPAGNNYCPGDTFIVPYIVSGDFGACSTNTFTAQLSNSYGNFSSSVLNIGSVTSDTSGAISCVIPLGTLTGTKYKVRVVSSMPQINGIDNSVEINIGTTVNSWQQRATFPTNGRSAPSSIGIGDYGYIGLGYDGTNFKNDWWQYDPVADIWTQKADFGGVPRAYAVSFEVNGNGYVGTGLISISGTNASDFWEYNPVNNQWIQVANFPGSARDEAIGFSIGSKGYVFGGVHSPSSTLYNDLYEFNPQTNSWTNKANLPAVARGGAIGFGINGLGYVGMGSDAGSNLLNDFWAFNPQTNSWIARATFPAQGRRQAVSVSLGTSGYMSCGLNGSTYFKDLWEYDSKINSWTPKAVLSGPGRKLPACFAVKNKLYVCMGASQTAVLNDLWEYNVQPIITTLPLSRHQYCAGDTLTVNFNASGTFGQCSTNIFSVQLSNNNGNFSSATTIGSITGNSNAAVLCTIPSSVPSGIRYRVRVISSDIEVNGADNGIDLAIGVAPAFWTQKAGVGSINRQNAVAFSINGKGYVGTGYKDGSGGGYLSDFWEFDTLSNVWTQKASFGGGVRTKCIGFAIGGKGYVGTGYDASNIIKNDFWEYDPVNNSWIQKANVGGNVRYDAFSFALNGKGYVGCGTDSYNWLTDFWEYNPVSDQWIQRNNFAGGGRTGACTFVSGNMGYVSTGSAPYGVYKDDLWQYDPNTDSWNIKNSFDGGGRYKAVGLGINGKGYIALGNNNFGASVELWEYDTTNDNWKQLSDFPGGSRYNPVGFSIGTKGYIGTGNFMYDIYSFDPALHLSVDSVSPSGILCPGASFSVHYTAIGDFGICTGNSFTAQLSDANGNFYNPVNIGTVTSTISGSILCTIPLGTINSINYKLRLVSSNPAIVSPLKNNLVVGANTGVYWTTIAPMPASTGRRFAASFSIGDKGYFGTGEDGTSYYRDLWEYDPVSESWTQKAMLPGDFRMGAVGFALQNKGYIGTGYSNTGTYLNDLWEYDPLANTWIQKANFGGAGRVWAVAFVIGNKAYLGTGRDGTPKQDFWEFDPSGNSWTQKSNFGGGLRFGASGCSIGSMGYIGTGNDGSVLKNDFWEYNPVTDQWLQKSNYSGGSVTGSSAFSIGKKGYLCLGINSSNYYSYYLYEFNPVTNSWLFLPSFKGTARYGAVAFVIGNMACLGSGFDGSFRNDFYVYHGSPFISADLTITSSLCASSYLNVPYTATGEFGGCSNNQFTAQLSDANGSFNSPSNIGSVVSDVSGTISATIPANAVNGTGYRIRVVSSNPEITGSDNGKNVFIGIPLNNAWVQKSSFPSTPRSGAFGFSIGTKGYFGGGNDGSTYRRDFWEYNPSTNIWTQKADFGGTARYGAGTFVLNNFGYIGCGDDGSAYFTNDFWQYDPVANLWTQKTSVPGPGPGGRLGPVGFAIGNKGYFATGYTAANNNFSNDLFEYDPIANSWIAKATYPGPGVYSAIAFSIGNKGYVGAGADAGNIYNGFFEYNPATDSWSPKANIGGPPRVYASAFSIGGKGYVGGGAVTGGAAPGLNDFWEYNPATNQWSQKANLVGNGKSYSVAFAIGSRGYFGTGSDNGVRYGDFYEYIPSNELSTENITPNQYCPGSTVTVPYTAAGSYICSNIFTAELSDTNGSFNSPSVIGSVVSDVSGTINATIPANTPPGSGYRIRVNSDHPSIPGVDNGEDILINMNQFTTSYRDDDNDGYGDPADSISACTVQVGYVLNNTDCNDNDSTVNPIASELCNGIDDNCDGYTDEGLTNTYFEDTDNDTYGNYYSSVESCTQPVGYVTDSTDCNDTIPAIHPGAIDICGNGIDEDCSGDDAVCSIPLVLNLKVFIEGYYNGNSQMIPALYNSGLNTNPTDCDTIFVELRDPLSPATVVNSAIALLSTNGNATAVFSPMIPGNAWYVVVKNRNSIETWSKLPVVLNAMASYDFTQ